MQLKWANQTVHVTRQPLTRDWWEWICDVLPSGQLLSVAKFAQQFVDIDVEANAHAGLYELTGAIFAACQPDAMHACMQLVYGVDKLDTTKIPKTCACDACAGYALTSTDCRFSEVGATHLTRLIVAQEPDLIAQMWDLPYSLYYVALEQRQASRLGALAQHYPVESVRRERTHDAAFQRLRRYHGHA